MLAICLINEASEWEVIDGQKCNCIHNLSVFVLGAHRPNAGDFQRAPDITDRGRPLPKLCGLWRKHIC